MLHVKLCVYMFEYRNGMSAFNFKQDPLRHHGQNTIQKWESDCTSSALNTVPLDAKQIHP